MSFMGCCPQCGQNIPQKRYVASVAVCSCGWHDSRSSSKAVKDIEKKAITGMIAVCVAITALYVHSVNWGNYAFKIPVVKIEQLTGTLSNEGYRELAETCTNLGKYDCAKNAYLGLYQIRGDINGLAELGKLNMRLSNNDEAIAAYSTYLKVGGNSYETTLEYARTLENAGRTDEAFKMYETASLSAGEKLPVQAMTGQVRLLMKQGKYEEALTRIQAFQDSAGNAKGYLNTELAQLEQYLGAQAKAGSSSGKNRKIAKAKRVAGL
jgi:tetratricopeptide (TPR) repeat protein